MSSNNLNVCDKCGEIFTSKNKLFNHLRFKEKLTTTATKMIVNFYDQTMSLASTQTIVTDRTPEQFVTDESIWFGKVEILSTEFVDVSF